MIKGAFDREALEALFDELQREWQGKHQLDRLIRDAHLAIALHDADRPLGQDIDPWVVELIHRHSRAEQQSVPLHMTCPPSYRSL